MKWSEWQKLTPEQKREVFEAYKVAYKKAIKRSST